MKQMFLFMLLVFMFFSTLNVNSSYLFDSSTAEGQYATSTNSLSKARHEAINNQAARGLLASFNGNTSSSTQLAYFNKLKYPSQIDLFKILSPAEKRLLFPKLTLDLQAKLLPQATKKEQDELFKLMVYSGQITDKNKNDFLKYCSVEDKARLLSLNTPESIEYEAKSKYWELKEFDDIDKIRGNPEKLRELVEGIYRESRTGDLLERLASLNAKNANPKQRDFIEGLLFGDNAEVDEALSVNKNLYEGFVGDWRLAMQDKVIGKKILDQDVANLKEYSTQLENGNLSATDKAYLKNLIDTLNQETSGEGATRFALLKAALSSDSNVLDLLNQTGDNYQALNPSDAEQDSPAPIDSFNAVNDSINAFADNAAVEEPEEFEAQEL